MGFYKHSNNYFAQKNIYDKMNGTAQRRNEELQRVYAAMRADEASRNSQPPASSTTSRGDKKN